MNKTKIAFVLMGASIFILSGMIIYSYFSETKEIQRSPNFEMFLSRMKEDLELTEEQIEKIRSVHAPLEEKLGENNRRIIRMRMDLEKFIFADSFDENEIRRVMEDIDSLRRENHMFFIRMRFEDEKILTNPQKIIFRQNICRPVRFEKKWGFFNSETVPPKRRSGQDPELEPERP